MVGPNDTERWFIDAHGADDDAILEGVRWLLGYAEDHGLSRVSLFLPGLQQVDPLRRALGSEVVSALKKNSEVRAGSVTIQLLIPTRLSMAHRPEPVLAVWADNKQLVKIDDMYPVAVCAIPWNRADIDGWKSNWNPTDLRTGNHGGSETAVSNPVVEAALRSLTDRINVGTGLTHPSDKPAGVQMFHLLKAAGEPSSHQRWRHGRCAMAGMGDTQVT